MSRAKEFDHGDGSIISVIYVDKRDAKSMKTSLQKAGIIDKRFRMCPAVIEPSQTSPTVPKDLAIYDESTLESSQPPLLSSSSWIAIPIVPTYQPRSSSDSAPTSVDNIRRQLSELSIDESLIKHIGHQYCPFSTSVLGNSNSHKIGLMASVERSRRENDWNRPELSNSTAASSQERQQAVSASDKISNLSITQSVLFDVCRRNANRRFHDELSIERCPTDTPTTTTNILSTTRADDMKLLNDILSLNELTVCPRKIEFIGDDRTLVIPSTAFRIEGDDDSSFQGLLLSVIDRNHKAPPADESNKRVADSDDQEPTTDENVSIKMEKIRDEFFQHLTRAYKSQRIVSRGRISIDSKVRQSGHRLVWPQKSDYEDGIPPTSGPDTPESWICVTEQGIRQSFDLTRVMFSRGNISEKIRFGNHLVQEDEIVLDMYAGIGYYTLPAVLKGKARKVYACEWNPYAAQALQFNVTDNRIRDRVEVLIGDCRLMVQQHNIINCVDRVSLGLLPSSEGGWKTAVRALKSATGCWLHVHANVPDKERDVWSIWLCKQLHSYLPDREGEETPDWLVVCTHIERVKSFAPTVSHFVADVFLGPYKRFMKYCDDKRLDAVVEKKLMYGVLNFDSVTRKHVVSIPDDDLRVPSCALSANGVLSQEWMR